MKSQQSNLFKVIPILKSTFNILWDRKVIFFPFLMTAFIQIILLEVLYFSVRYPLNVFFGPIISKLWNNTFLHYPLNFVLLPKLFQYGQIPIYLFVGSFLTATAISIIEAINSDKRIDMGMIIKKNFASYVHIVVAGMITFVLILLYSEVYGKIIERALQIQSTGGVFGLIKRVVVAGAPYFNLVASSFITAMFAYVLPIIVIDKKKVSAAIRTNFKLLSNSFWFTFFIIFIPALIYFPVILLRDYSPFDGVVPEWRLWVLLLSILAMMVIDAIVYTALTMVYLLKKENA